MGNFAKPPFTWPWEITNLQVWLTNHPPTDYRWGYGPYCATEVWFRDCSKWSCNYGPGLLTIVIPASRKSWPLFANFWQLGGLSLGLGVFDLGSFSRVVLWLLTPKYFNHSLRQHQPSIKLQHTTLEHATTQKTSSRTSWSFLDVQPQNSSNQTLKSISHYFDELPTHKINTKL